jgi:hypothetical protein
MSSWHSAQLLTVKQLPINDNYKDTASIFRVGVSQDEKVAVIHKLFSQVATFLPLRWEQYVLTKDW